MNDRIVTLALIVVSSLLCVVGQALAKLGLARLALPATARAADLLRVLGSPLVWLGGGLLVIGTLVWFRALATAEFSMAMPISCLLMLVFSVVIGIACFGEPVSLLRSAGLALALVAILLIAS